MCVMFVAFSWQIRTYDGAWFMLITEGRVSLHNVHIVSHICGRFRSDGHEKNL